METILDYLTQSPIIATPEEYNRQAMLKILHEDYGYPKDLIMKEFGVKRSPSDNRRSVPVDIAVFENKETLKDKSPKIFVEVKRDNITAGIEQLKDYMTFSRDVSYGIWYNGENSEGESIAFIKKSFIDGSPIFEEILDIPRYGFQTVDEQIKYTDLKPTNNLKVIFKNLRGYIAANATGTTRDEKILEQLSMIIISKLYDEKYAESDYVKFRVINHNANETSHAIKELFKEASLRWDDVFESTDKIELDNSIIMKIVALLQRYSLLESSRNVISEAFESIITYATKGSQGQFFTPKNIVELMVTIANPKENETVFDPACGTAGFLVGPMFHVWEQIERTHLRSQAKYDKKQQYATNHLYGIEKDSFLAKIAKSYMAVLGDGRAGIFIEDTLNHEKWGLSTKAKIENKKFDIILTNPPFGKDVKIAEESKKHYEFPESIEIAFLEKSIDSLNDGGLLGIILPETIFHAPTKKAIREKFFYKHNITHIIDLPHDTFRPYNNAKTNIIFIRKNQVQGEFITCIKINEMGHDHLGKEKFRLNKNTMKFTDEVADDIPIIIDMIKSNKIDSEFIKYVKSSKIIDSDILVARPFFAIEPKKHHISLGSLIENGVISAFDGHGSPQSVFKGLGNNPYIRVKDVVNLEIAHNRLDDIPDSEYQRLYSEKKKLREKDIVFVRRGSYRIGDVGILYKKDLHSILTREILILRVNQNELGITPFNLLALLNSDEVRAQLSNLILIDTTLPNIADRWKSIQINISDINRLKMLDKKMKDMYNMRSQFWDEYYRVF